MVSLGSGLIFYPFQNMLKAPYRNNITLSPCHVFGHLPPFAFSILLIWIASIFYPAVCLYSPRSTNISLLSSPVISFLPNPRAVFQLFILNLFVMTHQFYLLLKFSLASLTLHFLAFSLIFTYSLCGIRRLTSPFWAGVSSVKWGV